MACAAAACGLRASGHIDRRIEPPGDTPNSRGQSRHFSYETLDIGVATPSVDAEQNHRLHRRAGSVE
jgi:hypothetical protein